MKKSLVLSLFVLACGSSSTEAPTPTDAPASMNAPPAPALVAPSWVTVGEPATVHASLLPGEHCAWSATNATVGVGQGSSTIEVTPNAPGKVTVTCTPSNDAGDPGPASSAHANAVDAPAIATFTPTKDATLAFGTVALRFETAGGTGKITPGDLDATGSGTVFVKPGAATTYTLTVTGPTGSSVARTAHVDVMPASQLVIALTGDVPPVPEISVGTPDARVIAASGPLTLDAVAPGKYSVTAPAVDSFGAHYAVSVDDPNPDLAANASTVVTVKYQKTDLAPSLAPIPDQVVFTGTGASAPLSITDPSGGAPTIEAETLTPTTLHAASMSIQNGMLVLAPDGARGRGLLRVTVHGALGMSASRVVRVASGDVGVTNVSDSGAGSLRAAIAAVPSSGAIVFAPTAVGTITLASEIPLTRAMAILGPGADKLTIDGANATRLFSMSGVAGVELEALTLARGSAGATSSPPGRGGAVYITSAAGALALTIRDSELRDDVALGSGGAINALHGSVALERTTIANGTAQLSGGGIYMGDALDTLTMVDCTLTGNTVTAGAPAEGAAVATLASTHLVQTTISGNKAVSAGGDAHGAGISIVTGPQTSAVVRLEASIIANNIVQGATTRSADIAIASQASIVSDEYNVVGDGGGLPWGVYDMTGTSAAPVDAKLGALLLRAGATIRTRVPLAGSPVIGFVPRTFESVPVDANGVPRTAASAAGAAEP